MIQNIGRCMMIVMACSLILGTAVGCGAKEEKVQTAKPVMAPGPAETASPVAALPAAQPAVTENKADDTGIAVEVDGVKMMKAQLNSAMQQKLAQLKDQIPPASLEQAKTEIRKGLIDEFVMLTVLKKELAAKKVIASEKEITEVLDSMKAQLPAGKTMDDLLKKNGIDMAKIREDIGMNIKMDKLVKQELGGKIKVTDKEISEFYEKNKEKFTTPESVHARHLLVSKVPEDTDKTKADKKVKAEGLQKKLVAGADFADLAAKNSDCPSKEKGGDLGTFTRGQMVKPFEDAAFSQQKNVIGPVVETDFGFHIIQVLEHQSAQIGKLDGEAKKRIIAFLERQKQQIAFEGMVKRLKAGANILVYGK
ncbi:MAG: peptidylprolyl isomerase [Syntrophales bacterium]